MIEKKIRHYDALGAPSTAPTGTAGRSRTAIRGAKSAIATVAAAGAHTIGFDQPRRDVDGR